MEGNFNRSINDSYFQETSFSSINDNIISSKPFLIYLDPNLTHHFRMFSPIGENWYFNNSLGQRLQQTHHDNQRPIHTQPGSEGLIQVFDYQSLVAELALIQEITPVSCLLKGTDPSIFQNLTIGMYPKMRLY